MCVWNHIELSKHAQSTTVEKDGFRYKVYLQPRTPASWNRARSVSVILFGSMTATPRYEPLKRSRASMRIELSVPYTLGNTMQAWSIPRLVSKSVALAMLAAFGV